MAYYNGNVAKGAYTEVICDKCAHSGAIEFTKDKFGVPKQADPWRWANWACGEVCKICKKLIP